MQIKLALFFSRCNVQLQRFPWARYECSLPKPRGLSRTVLGKMKKNGKVFCGLGAPSLKSTTTICGVNYQLLAAMQLK